MDRQKTKAFIDEFMGHAAGAMTIGLLAVADRTGLLKAMAGKPANTAEQIALDSDLELRYVTEVLGGLTAAGIVEYDPTSETFRITDEQAAVVADDASPYSMAGWLDMIPASFTQIDAVVEATINGGGVPFEAFGDEMIRGIDRAGSPSAAILLTRRWIASMPDVVARLTTGASAADLGCGSGSAVAAIASAFPKSTVHGYDVSETSVERARERSNVPNADFTVGGSEALANDGPFDLITALDVIHDLADPVAALRHLRGALSDNGAVFIVEPLAADDLQDNVGAHATVLYGISTLHCMTQSLAQGGLGLGAVAGPRAIEDVCRQAGFESFEVLPIEHPFSAFFRVG